ncbi:hypothetical protein GCM10010176_089110 [Nonomuraea spiralis]|nr:hypothetical protein GCM10010176_089110 [Nonomuraea spiralis]
MEPGTHLTAGRLPPAVCGGWNSVPALRVFHRLWGLCPTGFPFSHLDVKMPFVEVKAPQFP